MKRSLLRTLRQVDRLFVRLSRTVQEWLGKEPTWPIQIMPYRGYGRTDWVSIRGRVIKDRRIIKDEVNSTWRALINNYKRFNSREIIGATIRIEIGGHPYILQTDDEGYFLLEGPLKQPLDLPELDWYTAQVHLEETPRRKTNVRSWVPMLIPHPEASFGFISDVDDTILKTDVTSLLKLRVLYHTLLKTAALRQSFGKAAAFFQALRCGVGHQPCNPVFYVSNSPWNLYDLLEEFLSLNNLPEGPILLRDFGLPYQDNPEGYLGHKHGSILRIIDTYPDLPFVLIGDSGENDPYIYEAVAKARPGRIRAIYIRDVRSLSRARRIKRFIERTGVDMKLVDNYQQAAKDAAARGLIQEAYFQQLTQSGSKS
ncbi:MAG: DUF2183 domain-containing protein [Phaeodactylibacter sp.]|uniref:App1 family protein n=1 Tax=Phaeodactylibacter sp. TaxID=1940289 RepID=UPI0032EAEEE2